MTADIDGSPCPDGGRVAWSVVADRRPVFVTCRGADTDTGLLSTVPRIWQEHPEVIGYDTVVDARALTSEGGWAWPTLRDIARQWRDFAQGLDLGRRAAIVTRDNWVAMLVGAFVLDYRGRRFRCFGEPEAAREWARGS